MRREIDWDDPIEPKTLDSIIKELGADSINYTAKMDCCGNPCSKTDENLSNELIYKKLRSIQNFTRNYAVLIKRTNWN